MTFAYPWVLSLVLLPLAMAPWRRRRDLGLAVPSLRLWAHAEGGRVRFLWMAPALRILGFSCLVFALARPQGGSIHSEQMAEGIAIQLLVDVSSSMSMDIKLPGGDSRSRIEVARELVERFIAGDNENLKGREGDLIGLITFARYADTRSPLTLWHDALLAIVRDLEVQDRPNEDGTAYGDALALAAARLEQLDDPEIRKMRSLEGHPSSRVIILLTDGENNSGTHLPVEAAGLAREWGCRIYCISLGERPGAAAEEGPVRLSDAERVLEHISLETGGVFRTATDYDSLLAVYAEIDALERSRIVTRNYTRLAEWFQMPLGLSLLLLLAGFWLEATWLRTIP